MSLSGLSSAKQAYLSRFRSTFSFSRQQSFSRLFPVRRTEYEGKTRSEYSRGLPPGSKGWEGKRSAAKISISCRSRAMQSSRHTWFSDEDGNTVRSADKRPCSLHHHGNNKDMTHTDFHLHSKGFTCIRLSTFYTLTPISTGSDGTAQTKGCFDSTSHGCYQLLCPCLEMIYFCFSDSLREKPALLAGIRRPTITEQNHISLHDSHFSLR